MPTWKYYDKKYKLWNPKRKQALEKLLETEGDETQVVLMYGNRDVPDILLREKLDAWALAHDWDHEEILELFERHGHVWGEQTRTKDPVGPRWRKWPDVEAADEKYQREQELAKQEKPTEYDAKIGERLR